MNKTANVDLVIPTPDENEVLDQLDKSYRELSEMSPDHAAFLNALILRKRPKKLLELGVSAGGSSIIMLNSIKEFPEAKLYSIDLMDNWYKDNTKRTGFFVDNYPSLKPKWELFTGRLALNFMDKIQGGVDFCLIDTAHINPGEMFDVLMVLPFLDDNAIIVFHDISLHTWYFLNKKYLLAEKAITNNLLMSAVTGKKLLPGNHGGEYFPNIAGININSDTKENVFEIFNLLMLRWGYLPTEKQEQEIMWFCEKYYDKYYIDYLRKVFLYQRTVTANDKHYRRKNTLKKVLGERNVIRIKKIMGRK